MKIKDKIKLEYDGLIKHGPITIVAFGDSVTHGAFEIGKLDYDWVYHKLLADKIRAVNDYVPVNVINAGIGGITASGSLGRYESQALAHNPDLLIVMFGLNDVNGPLDAYLGALKEIFDKATARGIDVIFMTPNMLNTYVAEDAPKEYYDYAGVTAQMQTNGKMDTYMQEAVRVAKDCGVKVADCYAKWKELSKTQDVTMLLANRINHPTREMHRLFADTLFDLIFDGEEVEATDNNTMYR
ncbi:MAG: SGNH/GDSL hydrolase family protein [Clostridia bacterium]|nr:SGNH/GDSL hydrolase family protein [Clostridia bacterium]